MTDLIELRRRMNASLLRAVEQAPVLPPPAKDGLAQVTPLQAASWLKNRDHQRRWSLRLIEFFKNEIETGRWVVNGQTISFMRDGRLNDGQHRLAGMALAGKICPVHVVTGVEPDAFWTVDSGNVRRASDVLQIAGIAQPDTLSAAAKIGLAYDRHGIMYNSSGLMRDRVGNDEVMQYVKDHPSLISSAERYPTAAAITKGRRANFLKQLTPGIAIFLDWKLRELDPKLAPVFMEEIASGAGLEAGNPILVLRDTITSMRAQKKILRRSTILCYAVKTWNAWRQGGTVTRLMWKKDEEFPEIEGPKASPATYGRGTLRLRREDRPEA